MQIILIIILSFFIQACAGNKPSTIAQQDIDPFWYNFADPKLNDLVKEALNANSDVLMAMVNISKAQAALQTSEANRLPEIDLQGSASKSRDSENMLSTFVHKPYNSFNLSAVLSYQVDLWGKMANANKAAKAQLLSLESTKRAVKITIASEVSKAYFNLIGLDDKIRITSSLVNLADNLYKLKLKQLREGVIDNSNVQRAKSQLHLANSQLLNLKRQLNNQENALAIILGRDISLSSIIRGKDLENFAIIKLPDNLSSKILLKRPDIMAAEQMLIAAKYQVKVARASYFPEISLNSLFGLSSNDLNELFTSKSRARNFGTNVMIPTLNFGRIDANVQYAEATKSQYIIEYQQTVRVAFAEALTSIYAQKNSCENFIQMKYNEQSIKKLYNITNKQLKVGLIDYITTIEEEKNFLATKIDVVDAAQLRVNSTVDVFKAFAGNFE